MRTTTTMLRLGGVLFLAMASGCSKPNPTPPQSDLTALQGAWQSQEMDANATGLASLAVSGSNLEFHGADTNEWYKASFTLQPDKSPKQLIAVVRECPFPDYVGKTVNAIYRLEGGTLTLVGNSPGNPEIPAAFNVPGQRQLVFKAAKP